MEADGGGRTPPDGAPPPTAATPLSAAALARHVRAAFEAADAGSPELPPGVMAAEGMSGAATRRLYAALCRLPGCHCLQVGIWKGSSVFAALAGNPHARVTAVDNWSEFGGPRAAFEAAAAALLTRDERARLQVVDGDAFDLDPLLLDDYFNMYIYDGAHDYESQVWAITAMWRHLAQAAIVVIDDLNFDAVRQGTQDGFAAVGGDVRAVAAAGAAHATRGGGGGGDRGGAERPAGGVVVAAFERRLTRDGSHTPLAEAAAGYWNGVGVYVVDKRAAHAGGQPAAPGAPR